MNDISVNKIPNFNDLSISEKKAYYEFVIKLMDTKERGNIDELY